MAAEEKKILEEEIDIFQDSGAKLKNDFFSLLVFLVEDSDMYALMLEHKLGKNKNVVFKKFNSGEECLRNLHLKPGMVILDYNLQGMDGLETLKMIKKINFDLPVVILSAQQDLKVAISMFGEGAFDYITKDADTLVEVNKAIDKILSARAKKS